MNPEIKLRSISGTPLPMCSTAGIPYWLTRWARVKPLKWLPRLWRPKRLGLCQKSLFVVPNHLTLQWAQEFLHLYPSAKLLVASKKDFETANRKKFCARIATGDYDAVIIRALTI